ncbi:hypothetical protein FW755_09870 [Lonepinella koalarum]|uniref:Uncharacterized protein n=1 Tax=Lonepinella koalarum TaxID=53417 RepID=A0A4R1KT42_9PAST|nr:hypothetical protein [Lonepinella koalarum]MDH2927571.1 hypothetical protein [Lonepinella koalarum]TCK68286.1 hypothetical protein EV692_1616 [Lonepinella koalarum]TFJ89544.1 hypothetical protein E0709_07340 [Lonepinella koalarum]TYG35368.1 hypothetical protein FW755_09870 [Lonepinella koalarum]
MVNFKTSIRSSLPTAHLRNQALLQFLQCRHYAICHQADQWVACSHHIEAEQAKKELRQQGFSDNEFQIQLEYQREWGFL